MQKNNKYYLHLDGIRAIAVLLVLVWHWMPMSHTINMFGNGVNGVNLFFVLSGFLITSILMDYRALPISKALITFYKRRSIRIFPIYYLLILIIYLAGYSSIRDLWYVYATYSFNIYFWLTQDTTDYLLHFWSLCVEEQFYLVWPLIILLFAKDEKRLKIIAIGTIAIGLLAKYFNGFFLSEYYHHNYFTLFALDALGMGALLAALYRENAQQLKKYVNNYTILGSLLIFVIFKMLLPSTYLTRVLTDFMFVAFSFFFVAKGIYGFNGYAKVFFENTFLRYIGRISYGIYLYHFLMQPFNHWLHEIALANNLRWPVINVILFPEFSNIYLRFGYLFLLTLFIASMSWLLVERPISRLKGSTNHGMKVP